MNHLHTVICLIRLIFMKSDWISWSSPPRGRARRSCDWKNPMMWPLETKMAANQQDLIDLEAYSCLAKSITRFLQEEMARTGLPCDHPAVIQSCISYFNWGSTQNQCWNTMIWQIAALAWAVAEWVSGLWSDLRTTHLFYWPWGTAHTNRSKFWWLIGPKLKWATVACTTRGWVLGLPCLWASRANFRTMFWWRKLRMSSLLEWSCAHRCCSTPWQ